MTHQLRLTVLEGEYSVVRYRRAEAQVIEVPTSGFVSLSSSEHETSLVCRSELVATSPSPQHHERGWRLFRFEGPFEFTLTGVLAAVAQPLARAEVGIFAVSTYDTDYVMVKATQLDRSIDVLRVAGHQVDHCFDGEPAVEEPPVHHPKDRERIQE